MQVWAIHTKVDEIMYLKLCAKVWEMHTSTSYILQ